MVETWLTTPGGRLTETKPIEGETHAEPMSPIASMAPETYAEPQGRASEVEPGYWRTEVKPV